MTQVETWHNRGVAKIEVGMSPHATKEAESLMSYKACKASCFAKFKLGHYFWVTIISSHLSMNQPL